MARSATGRNSGIASSSVTVLPSRAHTLPSSSPITPAPMMPRRAGTSVKSSAPAESTMRTPSSGATGSGVGREPVARMMCSADTVTTAPSAPVTSTLPSPASRPLPFSHVTPFFLNSPPMPPVNWRTMPSLRATMAAGSIVTSPTVMPWAARPCRARWYCSDDSSSAFDGIQPTLRQVPPSAGLPSLPTQRSTQAVLSPSWAARMAAT